MLPEFVLFHLRMHAAHILPRLGTLRVGIDIKDAHSLEFPGGIAIKARSGLVDTQESQRIDFVEPGWQRIVLKEQTQHRLIAARVFLRTAPFDRESDVAANGLEKFEVAQV